VVLVLNYDRGAGVYAAYLEGGIWKRTIEQDSDFPSADLARQASVSGWVAADKRMIGSKAFSFRITPEWKDESNPRCEFSHPEGEPVLDNHQVVECRETLYRNVSHLGMKSSLHAA